MGEENFFTGLAEFIIYTAIVVGVTSTCFPNCGTSKRIEKIVDSEKKSIYVGKRTGIDTYYIQENDTTYTRMNKYLKKIPDKYDRRIQKAKFKKAIKYQKSINR
ncbi:MAG: hypothetical protein KJ949_00610 [Nanoarchaeota archaeon]|nr:hypothetical protein [Nanoarchaeota archaeon]MBU4308489.1 hypothetical protein [Nanoarchaeota archaeon]